ncbi:hypothetical protein KM043_007782 [Ampulex compressa]|nr:hypothetical protein KM043_007782 [Ampulex compressa]
MAEAAARGGVALTGLSVSLGTAARLSRAKGKKNLACFLVSASSHTWSFSWIAQSTARLNTNRETRPNILQPVRRAQCQIDNLPNHSQKSRLGIQRISTTPKCNVASTP